MRTKFRDGLIRVHLSKPETALVEKALELVTALSKMQPINEMLSDEAVIASESLGSLLKSVRHDAEAPRPLWDNLPERSAVRAGGPVTPEATKPSDAPPAEPAKDAEAKQPEPPKGKGKKKE